MTPSDREILTRFKSGEHWTRIVKQMGVTAAEVIGALYRAGELDRVPAAAMRPADSLKKALRQRTIRRAEQAEREYRMSLAQPGVPRDH